MKLSSRFSAILSVAVAVALPGSAGTLRAVDSQTVKGLFAQPPREYATAPLWVWNDQLTEAQIRDTLRDLAGQQVKQVFVHPRPGLMTPYLSADWFRLWKVALDEAERLDMNVWIYDENSYPSGFAGGWVPELMPESRGMGLHLREAKAAPPWADNLAAVLRLAGDQTHNVTAQVQAGAALPAGRYVVAEVRRAGNSPWHGNRCYVNLLTPGVTEKFIEVTFEAYKREIGRHFGQRVPGIFTDEPEIRPAGGLPWCEDLPAQFQQRWGYRLLDNLASLSHEVGNWRTVRHDYFATLSALFIERWARPCYEWCEQNGLEFTGHYWDHDWPQCVGVPDNMAMAAWQQRPGIDCLMNQYAENTHAQFGNVRFCREVSSIANQLGRKRTLVELYGAGGWDLRFEDMKRIGDWLQVLGINTMDEHLSYITLRGARKRDHPQSFSYHEPWWEAYHVSAQYLARLSCAMSQGEQLNHVLVIEPTTTAWMYQGNNARLSELGNAFFNLLMSLEAAQVEYDLGCEDVIARHGSVAGRELRVGQRNYRVVVLPPHTENISSALLQFGTEFLEAGGQVICLGDPPSHVDGRPSDRPAEGVSESGWTTAKPEAAVEVLHRLVGDFRVTGGTAAMSAQAAEVLNRIAPREGFRIHRDPGDAGILFHHRRQLDDGQLLLLVNTSMESPSSGTIESGLKGVEQWNLYTGEIEPFPFVKTNWVMGYGTTTKFAISVGDPSAARFGPVTGECVRASFTLPPSGSLLLFLSKQAMAPPPAVAEIVQNIPAAGPPAIRRLAPNVLTLDYVDITAGGETKTDMYFYQANQFAWQKNGMERNPWDSAVQFKDELISKTFPPDSGFEAGYEFTIEGAVPKDLSIVIERPDLYTITCNGKAVAATPGDWWLDKAFGRIPLRSAAQVGANRITLKARPFTMYHELEPAYVLGTFSLKPVERGFLIAPEQPLRLAPPVEQPVVTHGINPDGSMWLSAGIGFAAGTDDREPFVVFDLGKPVDLAAIHVWNYNENHVRNLTARGADKVRLRAATADQPDQFTLELGTFRLSRASGADAAADVLRVAAPGVRFLRCDMLSNQYGVQYPAFGVPEDNGFVGLAEVRFVAADGAIVNGARIARCSSELASHQRRAAYLVNGSGLTPKTRLGWNDQGHPFYAQGVAYAQTFNVPKPEGRFYVGLGQWLGSVAQVRVNGQAAGTIAAPPWECEVTPALKAGPNTIEVVVIGTLKNTLGPHHNGPGLGSAWPGMFHRGPHPGPPPGNSYHTVAYGLFEPFALRQVLTAN